jgi:hypothetical protein
VTRQPQRLDRTQTTNSLENDASATENLDRARECPDKKNINCVDDTNTHVYPEAPYREKTSEEAYTEESKFKKDEDCHDVATLTQEEIPDSSFFTNRTISTNHSKKQSKPLLIQAQLAI